MRIPSFISTQPPTTVYRHPSNRKMMSIFSVAPKPPSLLGYHRVLSPSAGVKVSPLCLGTMNFGTAWYDNPY